MVVLLSGCSAARLAYINGETLSYWWLDRYVTFNSDQRPWVKQQLASLFEWHRKTQLPTYAQLLKHAQIRVQNGSTESELRSDYDDIQKHILLLTDRALPALGELALSLTPDQIDNIERKIASSNDDYRKDHLRSDVEKRQRSRYKKTMKQAENWFGNFSPEQERQLRTLSDARPLNNELILASRMQRQAALISLLRNIQLEKPSREAAMALIRSYMVTVIDRSSNPEHKEFFDAFRTGSIQMTAAIVNGATPAQKAHFAKTAQRWIDDFTALSK